MGEKLLPSSPLFIIPISSRTSLKYSFLPLAYSDIAAADKIRTQKLGLTDIAFRSHLRRRGGASDLFDAGISLTDIKVVGHWSIGVLDAYLSYKESTLASIQKRGILRAEQRVANHWTSKIMVFLFAPRFGYRNFVFFFPSATRPPLNDPIPGHFCA